jgi:cytochrome c553
MDLRRCVVSTAFTTAALALFPFSVWAQKDSTVPPQIVSRNCSGCHGVRGNAQLPSFPRLAGLDAAYFQQRMKEFQAAPEPPSQELFYALALQAKYRKIKAASSPEALENMTGMAHAAQPEQVSAAAAWYAGQQAGSGRKPSNPAFLADGKSLFANGAPTQSVLACQDCHGQDGKGVGGAPRIAGQNAVYLANQLQRFRSGARGHAPEMGPVAKPLTDEQIRALAAYIQSL